MLFELHTVFLKIEIAHIKTAYHLFLNKVEIMNIEIAHIKVEIIIDYNKIAHEKNQLIYEWIVLHLWNLLGSKKQTALN